MNKSIIPTIKNNTIINPMQAIKDFKDNRYTIIEYLGKEFASFEEKPFNEIDALILSQFCYLNFNKIVPEIGEFTDWLELSSLYKAEYFERMIDKTLTPPQNLELLCAICASPRFRGMKLNYFLDIYNKTLEEQFSAITFKISKDNIVVAYRGTDLTITGWKEDFNMFFISPLPSQITAVKYLNTVAGKTEATSKITIVGHSKGGNLAVYSNAFCKDEISKRILKVYNLDGPGFPIDILNNCKFIKQQHKIIKIVPEGSLIGHMFEYEVEPVIVKSYNLGFLQHDPFSWKCESDSFVKCLDLGNSINYFDKSFNAWVHEMNIEQRKTMVDTIFTFVDCLNIENLDELAVSLFKQREEVKKVLKGMDNETSDCIKEIVKQFLLISLQTRFGNSNNFLIKSIIDKESTLN